MKWRLLMSLRALEFLEKLPARIRRRIRARIQEIEQYPDQCAEFSDTDESGRLVDGCVVDGYAIIYWQDFPDRHVKVMKIELADR